MGDLWHHSTLPFSQKTVRLGVVLAEKVPFMLISQQWIAACAGPPGLQLSQVESLRFWSQQRLDAEKSDITLASFLHAPQTQARSRLTVIYHAELKRTDWCCVEEIGLYPHSSLSLKPTIFFSIPNSRKVDLHQIGANSQFKSTEGTL